MIESYLLTLNPHLNMALIRSQRTKSDVYVGICFGNWEGKHPDRPRMNWYVGTEPADTCGICGQPFKVAKLIGGQEWTQALEHLYSGNTTNGTTNKADTPLTVPSVESQ